ncbi:MAG: 30S ribosomal protein S6e [Candidatus Aenigmatarchaeota archaeon]|nr:MAG: 30S ribosomal protein S6e [Candidatus Aenigmarchaeota archaeon]
MAELNFKIVVSDPKTRRAYQKEVEQKQSGLIGKKIGERFSGDSIGLPGYELEITGGSDRDGFPMRRDVEGTARKKILLSSGPGFHPKKKGQRKRKSIRGNTISTDISQINVKVVKYGQTPLEKLFGVEEKPKEEAKPKEKPQEEKPKEEKEKSEETAKKAEEKMGIKEVQS